MSIKQTLLNYISLELIEEDCDIGFEENLLADGMVDSMGMLRLVAFIDEQWRLSVPPEDFTIDNFRTIASLEKYLIARIGTNGAADA